MNPKKVGELDLKTRLEAGYPEPQPRSHQGSLLGVDAAGPDVGASLVNIHCFLCSTCFKDRNHWPK